MWEVVSCFSEENSIKCQSKCNVRLQFFFLHYLSHFDVEHTEVLDNFVIHMTVDRNVSFPRQ